MQKWLWQIYGSCLTVIVFGSLRNLVIQDSALRMYYTILMAFDSLYIVLFSLNVMSLLVNVLAVLVVFLYALNIPSSLKFWKIMFFVRIVLDITGHNYNIQYIKSAFYQNPTYGLASLGFFILPILPSYMAHYLYAFKKPQPLTT